ncbi:MAG: hypothetical protein C0602_11620 [Denitrovibrio sp.]|nr:MAG: hypothetical protein C0602_11620 [Denitrovibrio sp.]
MQEELSDSPKDQPDKSNPISERVYLERVRLFFGNAVGNMTGFLIGGIFIAIVLNLSEVRIDHIKIWLITILILVLGVAFVEYLFKKTTLTIDNAKKWVMVRGSSGVAIASMYGISPFLFQANSTVVPAMFLFIVFSAVIAIASTGYSIMPAYYIVLNCVIMVPLTIYFISKSGDMYNVLTFTAILWQLFILKKAWRVSKISIEAITLNEKLKDEVTHHLETKKELQRMATHDSLTGLPNRRLLNDLMEHELSRSLRYNGCFAVIFIDLDNFKMVNDTYGHNVGDKLLQKVASLLKSQTRESDIIARMGGDEFVIVYSDIKEDITEARTLSNRLLDVLKHPIELEGGLKVKAGISIGIALYPNNGSNITQLLNAADDAMYRVKSSGKNNIGFA